MGRRDALLGHIIPIPSQPVFALIPKCYQNRSRNPHSTTLEASMLNITKPMWLSCEEGGIQN